MNALARTVGLFSPFVLLFSFSNTEYPEKVLASFVVLPRICKRFGLSFRNTLATKHLCHTNQQIANVGLVTDDGFRMTEPGDRFDHPRPRPVCAPDHLIPFL